MEAGRASVSMFLFNCKNGRSYPPNLPPWNVLFYKSGVRVGGKGMHIYCQSDKLILAWARI